MKEIEEEDELSTKEEETEALEEEDGFVKGYSEEEDVDECAECGKALNSEAKKLTKEIESEKYVFCSKDCAKDFEESLKTEEA